jgi:hypothetical protein
MSNYRLKLCKISLKLAILKISSNNTYKVTDRAENRIVEISVEEILIRFKIWSAIKTVKSERVRGIKISFTGFKEAPLTLQSLLTFKKQVRKFEKYII